MPYIKVFSNIFDEVILIFNTVKKMKTHQEELVVIYELSFIYNFVPF